MCSQVWFINFHSSNKSESSLPAWLSDGSCCIREDGMLHFLWCLRAAWEPLLWLLLVFLSLIVHSVTACRYITINLKVKCNFPYSPSLTWNAFGLLLEMLLVFESRARQHIIYLYDIRLDIVFILSIAVLLNGVSLVLPWFMRQHYSKMM